ncbi:MAG: hypothetical protein LJE85_08520 [Gammaproteobacteria bacterium]|jgi:hypothetical protein|nr:hypothetical protein [Gammaproteobacteria bacterium]
MTQTSVIYRIDANNQLIDVDENWDRFALANDSPQLVRALVVRKPLFELISDPLSGHLYKLLIERVKHTGKTISFKFRCDSPAMRRYMHMEMVRQVENDGVCFKSTTEREEPREPVELLAPHAKRSDDLVIICSWCKRVKVSEDQWLDIEQGIQRLGLFDAEVLPQLSHGMCPDCNKSIWSNLIQ